MIVAFENGNNGDSGGLLCRYLDWDSNFFGFRIARVVPDCVSFEEIRDIIAWCRRHEIDCLYFLTSSSDGETIRLAEDNGFRLVDVRVTLERMIDSIGPESTDDPGSIVRSSRAEDLLALRRIAQGAFHDSRFYFDPHFPRNLCDSLYETWIEVSCSGYADAVLVAEAGGEIAGFITCKQTGDTTGQVGLLGVDSSQQGKGVGRLLVMASLNYFTSLGIQRVNVVTQGRNISAQRLYQRCGFISCSSQFWYHKWFEKMPMEQTA